jgi:topoisomerase IV subunit B
VLIDQKASIQELLNYYMGKNTQDRQEFIIDNLRIEKDVEEELVKLMVRHRY